MNIVLLIPNLFSGGAERQLSYLAKGLADRSYRVHVVTFYHGGVYWDELSQDSRITLYCLYRKNKWDFFIAYKLLAYCRDNNIDLIQGFLEPSSVIASFAALLLHIPLVIGVRSSNMVHAFGSRMYKLAERFIGNRLAERYVFNSYAGKRYNSDFGYRQAIMTVIPNGLLIPERGFREPFSDSCLHLGIVSRLDPMKDIPTMLRAFALLSSVIGDVKLLIYGDGESLYKNQLIAICNELGISENVYWSGWAADVWDVFDKVDIIISSSSEGEGMSNTLMEAMASGRVVVATDVGDARRLLDYNGEKYGYVVSPGSPVALKEAIIHAVDSKEISLQYAEHAKERIRHDYSNYVMVSSYDKIYRFLIN